MKTKKFFKKLQNPLALSNFLLLFIGFFLRHFHYLANRSFWLDEAYVALGLSVQSLKEILQLKPFASDLPLAPVGFLAVEKIFISFLGNNEFVLRLFPFICGVAALFLFYFVVKQHLDQKSRFFALALFVFNPFLIYYASELKPYSTDVLLAVGMIVFLPLLNKKTSSFFKMFFWGSLAAIAGFFSYIMIFLVLSFVLASFVCSFLSKEYQQLKKMSVFFLVWLIGFLLQYKLVLSKMVQNTGFTDGAIGNQYLPAETFSIETLRWAGTAFLSLFKNPGGLLGSWLMLGFFLLGAFSFYQRDKQKAFFLLFPIILACLAACFQKYPFGGRFVLFYLPFLCVLIAEGVRFLAYRIKSKKDILHIALMTVVLFYPLLTAVKNVYFPKEKSDNRIVLKRLFKYFQPGDALFMNNAAQYAFGYYHGYLQQKAQVLLVRQVMCVPAQIEDIPQGVHFKEMYYLFDRKGFVRGVARDEAINVYLEKDREWFHQNPYTWVFLSHLPKECLAQVKDVLSKEGNEMFSFEREGAYLYLYDLRVTEEKQLDVSGKDEGN